MLNRIQNIVVPPRRPPGFRIHRNQFGLRDRHLSWHQLVMARFFPVDFSSTFSRMLLRVPSMYLLGKAVILWAALLLQAQQGSAVAAVSWLQPLGAWAASKKMEDVCWYTFLSACIALCIGTLTTGLEGLNMNDTSPFNLVRRFHVFLCSAVLMFCSSLRLPSSYMFARLPITYRRRKRRRHPGQTYMSSSRSCYRSFKSV